MNRQYLGLSGLAMALVVMRHALELGATALGSRALSSGAELLIYDLLYFLGEIAVPLFLFVAGGFTAYAARGNPPQLSWQWVQTTLLRLLWPYLLWSGVFYFVIFLQRGESYSPLGYVKNLLVGYPFHFMPLLILFYLLSPLLAHFARRHAAATLGVITLYQVFLLIGKYPAMWGFSLPAWMEILIPPVVSDTFALWGLYFPLGLVIGLHGKRVKAVLQRYQWGLAGAAVLFYVLAVLHIHRGFIPLYTLSCVALAPVVRRDQIPGIAWFEEVGKRSYGVYLTHLIVLNLGLMAVGAFVPGLLAYPWLLSAGLFVAGLFLPLLVMQVVWKLPPRATWRYVFG